MKRIIAAFMLAFLAAPAIRPAAADKTGAITPEESDRIISLAFERGAGIYKKYSGIESLRKEVISEYDPATGKLKSVSEITMKRKDYFYKSPEVEVLTYKKDGRDMEPSKFRVMKAMPLFPVFDEKGRDNYRITVAEKVSHGGRQCYRVQVDPRNTTSRHFEGSIYMAVRGLEITGIEGTMAKLDFPIKEFRIELNTKKIDDVPVAQTGKVRVRISVPLFYPDTMIESDLTTIEARPMK